MYQFDIQKWYSTILGSPASGQWGRETPLCLLRNLPVSQNSRRSKRWNQENMPRSNTQSELKTDVSSETTVRVRPPNYPGLHLSYILHRNCFRSRPPDRNFNIPITILAGHVDSWCQSNVHVSAISQHLPLSWVCSYSFICLRVLGQRPCGRLQSFHNLTRTRTRMRTRTRTHTRCFLDTALSF